MTTGPINTAAITLPGWVGTAVAITVSIASPVYVSGRYAAQIDAAQTEITRLRADVAAVRTELRDELRELRAVMLEAKRGGR